MSTWIPIAAVVVGFIVVGLLLERRRASRLESGVRAKGLTYRAPFAGPEGSPARRLANRFAIHAGRAWGTSVEGVIDGTPITLAEHIAGGSGASECWTTLVIWPARSFRGALVIWPRAPESTLSDAGVADRLGVAQDISERLRHRPTPGLLVEATPEVYDSWRTDARVRAFAAWRHGGAFAIDGGHAAWRVDGLITIGRLDTLLAQWSEARRLVE